MTQSKVTSERGFLVVGRDVGVEEAAMLHWTDLVGCVGMALTVFGTLLLFPGSEEHMGWQYSLGGLVM